MDNLLSPLRNDGPASAKSRPVNPPLACSRSSALNLPKHVSITSLQAGSRSPRRNCFASAATNFVKSLPSCAAP